MQLTLFNTLTKKEEIFTPMQKGVVNMYTCGPTVYGRPHIGNYASFLFADLLRRWLQVLGYIVHHVKNITDVGHLVADQDEGEDKIEKKAREEQSDPLLIAEKYTQEYLADEKALNMLEPEHRPKATETIQEMISTIKTLVQKGNAYETEDGIYFSVESFPTYGKLSGNTLDKLGKLEKGVRVELKESKKHPADFALWKKCVGENAKHMLRWSFATGERVNGEGEDTSAGFPGWHIECSAMSLKYLSDQLNQGKGEGGEGRGGYLIDIHTGGEDNIFPHHECEIAQSEAAFGIPFVHYWLHKRRVNFAEEKMSKSLGNVLHLPDIEERGFSPLDLRFFFLSTHYRSHTQFTWKGLEDAKKARIKISEWIADVRSTEEGSTETEFVSHTEKFTDAMNADLNTPEALAVVFDLMAESRKVHALGNTQVKHFAEMLQQTFGCFEEAAANVPQEVQKLANQRESARKAGDFALADDLRKKVGEMGFVIEDLPSGPRLVPQERRGIVQ